MALYGGFFGGEISFLWNGKDSAAYAVNDAMVSLTRFTVKYALGISTMPLADDVVDEDAASQTIDLSTGFSDGDGDALVNTVENSDTALLSASLSLAFQPDQNGSATIRVTAADPSGASATDAFDVTVNPVTDPPSAADACITVVAGKSQSITLDYGDLETV